MSELGPLQEIFERALELENDERAAFLNQACAGDESLRRHVEALLAADADPALEPPSVMFGETAGASPDLPSRLGPFEILSKIGEGGMGIVYEARQQTPRRIVALKVIRPGIASREVLRRFQLESEVLGQLQHQGIAQVYAAGTVDGRPWFAMERIHGLPIDVWVVRREADVRQRMVVLAAICDAVHHAHGKGIVHRDLKPANIVVDDAGQPKILDFGVARVTNGGEAMATMHTSTGQLVGTLAYMSPEQVGATGRAIDRRSDVYALGVILYELLAGRLPYTLQGQPIAEALRIIRDEEPSRLSSVSHRFRGDLETIAAKALAKEPDRRYDTAAELASDIRHYLADEPIVARPPSTWYQVRKFARRHRALVGAVFAVIVVLTLGVAVATTFAVREARQRALAEREAYRGAIAAASAEIRLGDGGGAAALLDGTNEKLRGWEWRYLRRTADRSLRTIPMREDFSKLAFSRDGKLLAVATFGGKLHAWNLDTGAALRLPASESTFERAQPVFSDDGRHLFVSDDGTHRTRSIALDTGALDWEVPYAGLGRLSFDRNGSLVFGIPDGFAVAVDPVDGHDLRRFRIGLAATDIGYLPDDKHVAYRTGAGLQIAELPSWRTVFSSPGRTTVSALGTRLLVELPGSRSTAILDEAGRTLCTIPVAVHDVHPLEPGIGVARAGKHGVALIDLATGEQDTILLGHAGPLYWEWFAPDGKRLVSHAQDGTLKTWDAATTPDPWVTRSSGCFHAVSPDGRLTAESGWGFVRVWDARTGWPLWTRLISRRGLKALAFDASGKRLVTVGDDGTVFVLDVERDGAQRELSRLPVQSFSAAWSRDGGELLIAGSDGVARILDARDGRELRRMGSAEASAHVVLALRDGATIATGGRGPDAGFLSWCTGTETVHGSGGVRLWDRASGRLLRTLDASPGTVTAMAAGTRQLAAGFEDGTVAIWDLSSEKQRRTPPTAAMVTGIASIRSNAASSWGARRRSRSSTSRRSSRWRWSRSLSLRSNPPHSRATERSSRPGARPRSWCSRRSPPRSCTNAALSPAASSVAWASCAGRSPIRTRSPRSSRWRTSTSPSARPRSRTRERWA